MLGAFVFAVAGWCVLTSPVHAGSTPRPDEIATLVAERSDAHDQTLHAWLAAGAPTAIVTTIAQLARVYERVDLVALLRDYADHRSPAVRGAVRHTWASLDPRMRHHVLATCFTDRSPMARRPCLDLAVAHPDPRHAPALLDWVVAGDRHAIAAFAASTDADIIDQLRAGRVVVPPPARALLAWALLTRADLGSPEQREWLEAWLKAHVASTIEDATP